MMIPAILHKAVPPKLRVNHKSWLNVAAQHWTMVRDCFQGRNSESIHSRVTTYILRKLRVSQVTQKVKVRVVLTISPAMEQRWWLSLPIGKALHRVHSRGKPMVYRWGMNQDPKPPPNKYKKLLKFHNHCPIYHWNLPWGLKKGIMKKLDISTCKLSPRKPPIKWPNITKN